MLCLTSCVKTHLGEATEKTVEITFNNGDKDTIVVTTRRVALTEGDLEIYVDDDPVYNYETAASGVRSFKILKK